MEDRYLFRGKRLDNGEWISGSLIHNAFIDAETGGPRYYIFSCDTSDVDCFEDMREDLEYFCVSPTTIGQCTGLKDKHGELIFEGDKLFCENILQYTTCPDDERFAVVSWNGTYTGGFIGDLRTSCYIIKPSAFAECEIIGNVHDDSEIMEESQ
jgi:uncharacterized phage protein (TIGR01671 family)